MSDVPDRFYPPLSAQEFFFAYPDAESVRDFFNATLGLPYRGLGPQTSIDPMSASVLDYMYRCSVQEYEKIIPAVFLPEMPMNVAIVAAAIWMKSKVDMDLHPNSGYLHKKEFVLTNRPLTLALASSAELSPTGELNVEMEIESMGLLDCARRTLCQLQRTGMVLRPVEEVDHNLLLQAEHQKELINRTVGLPEFQMELIWTKDEK